jgi:hypothetical protein
MALRAALGRSSTMGSSFSCNGGVSATGRLSHEQATELVESCCSCGLGGALLPRSSLPARMGHPDMWTRRSVNICCVRLQGRLLVYHAFQWTYLLVSMMWRWMMAVWRIRRSQLWSIRSAEFARGLLQTSIDVSETLDPLTSRILRAHSSIRSNSLGAVSNDSARTCRFSCLSRNRSFADYNIPPQLTNAYAKSFAVNTRQYCCSMR